MIRHIIKSIFLSFFLVTTVPIHIGARECETIFVKYNISPDIKSQRGWKRIIKKKELYKYIRDDIQYHDFNKLSKCLIIHGFNIKKYNRSIGEKL